MMPYTHEDRVEHMERQRRLLAKEREEREAYVEDMLRPIKDILDLCGEEGVLEKFGEEGIKLVNERPDYFYPGRFGNGPPKVTIDGSLILIDPPGEDE